MFSEFYEAEENKGFLRTHFFKRILTDQIDKELSCLKNKFDKKDITLDIHIEEKANNNFNFFLINTIKGIKGAENYLEEWTAVDVTNIYNFILYDTKFCKDTITDKKGYLILKLKYNSYISIITSYFKINCRNAKWDNDGKEWHIPLFYIFEMAKLTLFLGGTVSDGILYHLCKLFNHFSTVKNIRSDLMDKEGDKKEELKNGMTKKEDIEKGHTKGDTKEGSTEKKETEQTTVGTTVKTINETNKVEETYTMDSFLRNNKEAFLNFLRNTNVFRFEHLIVINEPKCDNLHIKIIPYKEEISEKRKTCNFFFWNTNEHTWVVKKKNFFSFYTHIIKGFDFKICSYYDYYKFEKQKLKCENTLPTQVGNSNGMGTGMNQEMKEKIEKRKNNKALNDIIKLNKKMKYNYSSSDSCASNELSNHVDSSYYEGRELVNKIKLIGAANNFYEEIIYNKLNKLKYLKPPNYTYDPKGMITQNGAGTKGIQIFDLPSDIYEWNRISFCIVPDDKNNVDIYDPKILCSLVSDVYLLKEKAIDIVLKRYKRWPEYTDVFWNSICAENEFVICNKNFNTRQKLAHDRLFHKQFFYIFQIDQIKQSNYYDSLFLCKTLILLGEGKLVDDPLEAEYIIIVNSQDEEALTFYNFLNLKKKKKLPLFVTPKYIYDCILNYCISYPSKTKKHVAFV